MSAASAYLAIDLGASGGRAMLGSFDGRRIDLREIRRFANEPVLLPEGLRWDAPRLFHEVTTSLGRADQTAPLRGIAIDTWGVDYGLLDRDGALIGLPVHYRDARTDGILPRSFTRMTRERLWHLTGCQAVPLTTLNQWHASAETEQRSIAHRLLLLPDLFSYWLSGEIGAERTNVSTTGLAVPGAGSWSRPVLEAFDLNASLLPPISEPGTHRGHLRSAIAQSLGCQPHLPVYATASHDTAAAYAATSTADTSLVISSGTWSLIGCLLPAAVLDPQADAAGFTNESGIGGTIRFLKGVAGLWLLQECRRAWERRGELHDYAALTAAAESTAPFGPLIDPMHRAFLAPAEMPRAIANFCTATGQQPPEDIGAIVRCALESIALTYRAVLTDIERLTGRHFASIHVVGGGSRNRLLCQLTADATGRPVLSGPSEATALGNVLMQLLAAGELADIDELRTVAAASSAIDRYEPEGTSDAWDEAEARMRQIIEVARETSD